MSLQETNTGIIRKVGFIHNGTINSFNEDIYLITVYVAGLFHYVDMNTFDKKINEKDSLDLFREPDNEYDKKAIMVKFKDEKIGYVPRQYNLILANLMDAGKRLYGKVANVSHGPYEGELDISFKIFMND